MKGMKGKRGGRKRNKQFQAEKRAVRVISSDLRHKESEKLGFVGSFGLFHKRDKQIEDSLQN